MDNLPQTIKYENNIFICTTHNIPLILHPKGHSHRTGKPYKEFYACPIKDKLGFCSSIFNPIRSKEEYKKIYKEEGYTSLTPEDMEWIDYNIH